MQPKVVIIVLNWNRKDDTVDCLNSLNKINYENYKILLIDNHSTDDSVSAIKHSFPDLEVIVNGDNLGYAEGNNVGIRHVLNGNAEYVLLLNNDTIVDPEFLSNMIKTAESESGIGIVGPKIYYYKFNGKDNVINSVGGTINYYTGTVSLYGFKEVDEGQYDLAQKVDYVEGACILIKRDVFDRIGYLNPKYFMYWEETDFCTRARKAGFKVITSPKAVIWHKSIPKMSLFLNQFRLYYTTRNMFFFERQNASRFALAIFTLYFFGYRFWKATAIMSLYFRNLSSIKAFYRGIIHGIMQSNLQTTTAQKSDKS